MFKIKNIGIAFLTVGMFIILVFFVASRIYSFRGNRMEKVTIGNHVFYAEIVSSDEKLEKGLGGRSNLCQSCAMLFDFTNTSQHAFTMKNMRFPLDIIWISNGKVVYLKKNVSNDFSDIIMSPNDSNRVLEINAGLSEKFGINIGDDISFGMF